MTPMLHTSTPQQLAPRTGDDWAEVLEPGETLLWHGRPYGGYLLRWRHLPLMIVGAAFLAYSAGPIQIAVAAWSGDDPARIGAVAIAVALVGLGLFFLMQPTVADMLRRRGTAYALSNRRALIETTFMGKELLAWPLTAENPILHRNGDHGSVWFAIYQPPRDISRRLWRAGQTQRARMIGFECLPESDHVHDLLQDIKKGAA